MIYTLGNRFSPAKDELIEYVAGLPDSKITHVSINKDFSGSAYPTIPEWLGYFKDADLVITNSFHGMVFSLIFNKKFIGLPSSGAKAGMNERLTTLMEEFGLESRLLFSFDIKKIKRLMEQECDWASVNTKIRNWIKQVDRFLDFDRFFSKPQHRLNHRENGQMVK